MSPLLPTRNHEEPKKESAHGRVATIDTRRWGPDERLVFEPYTQEAFDQSRDWIANHNIFTPEGLGSRTYGEAITPA